MQGDLGILGGGGGGGGGGVKELGKQLSFFFKFVIVIGVQKS